MKKMVACLFIIILLLSFTACDSGPQITVADVLQSFKDQGRPICYSIIYDNQNDPNGSSREGVAAYIEKGNFADSTIESVYDDYEPLSGTIELFKTPKEAKERLEYLIKTSQLGDYGYIFQSDHIVVRLSWRFSEEEAQNYADVFEQKILKIDYFERDVDDESASSASDEIEKANIFNCTADDLFAEIGKDDLFYLPVKKQNGKNTIMASGFKGIAGIRLLIFADTSTEIVRAISFEVPHGANRIALNNTGEAIAEALRFCNSEISISDKEISKAIQESENGEPYLIGQAYLQLFHDEDGIRFMIYPAGMDFKISDFPKRIEWSSDYFFVDEERAAQFKEAVNSYDFAKAAEQVSLFIENTDPPKEDLSYKLLDILRDEKLISAITSCSTTFDPVEENVSIYYNGVESINSQNNILAYIKNNELVYKIGFTKSDWVFFTECKINADSDIISKVFDYTGPTRDVINGGILESVTVSFNEKELEQICSSEEVIIRFSNKKDEKSVDHIVTQAEKDCLEKITLLRQTYRTLSDIGFSWEEYYA